MRDTKIRAWDKQDKRLITHEQEFVPLKVTNIGVFRQDCNTNKWDLMDRDRFILTQDLGITDKHGTEVYEGDLVTSYIPDTSGKMSIGVAIYENAKLTISCLSEIVCTAYDNHSDAERLRFVSDACTVLGNVFEDAELLPSWVEDPIALVSQ